MITFSQLSLSNKLSECANIALIQMTRKGNFKTAFLLAYNEQKFELHPIH